MPVRARFASLTDVDYHSGMARSDSTCWSVVLQAAAGDPVQREEFARRYDPVIRAYLATRWRLPRDHADVADASQEVFLQCFRDRGALERLDPDRPGGLRAFLYGVTAKTASELERKGARWRRNTSRDPIDPELHAAAELSNSRAFDKAWATMIAREARGLLIERAKNGTAVSRRRLYCLEQRYFNGKSPREIAPELGIDAQRVSELLYEGKLEYRAALFEIVASYFPKASEREIEDRCREIAGL